ncbi:MAG: hypothetical protein QXO37_09075 [Candidatus Nitrosocaldaceae archaeon]
MEVITFASTFTSFPADTFSLTNALTVCDQKSYTSTAEEIDNRFVWIYHSR